MGKRMVTCFASLAVVLGIFFPNSTLRLANAHNIENRLETYPIITYFPIMEKGKYEYVAFIGPDNNVWLIPQKGIGPREIQITTDGISGVGGGCYYESGYSQLRWSPDGKYLGAVRRDGVTSTIIMVDMSNYQVVTLLTGVQGTFDWMPGSQSIIYADGPYEYNWGGLYPGGLSVLDIKTGEKTKLISAPAGYRLINPDWAPGRNTGYFFVQQVPVPINPYASPMGLWKEGDPSYQIVPAIWDPSCDWSLDSQRMLCSYTMETTGGQFINGDFLTILDASGNILQTVPDPSTAGVSVVGQAWSGDNQWIAFRYGWAGGMPEPPSIEIWHENGISWLFYDSLSWAFYPIDLYPVDWSPDNQSLLFSSYTYLTPAVRDFLSINLLTRQFDLQFSGCEAAWQPAVQPP